VCSLQKQVDLMTAQLKANNITSWRTYAQAGMG